MKRLAVLALLALWGCGGGGGETPPPEQPLPQICSTLITWDAPSLYRSGLPLSPDDFDRFTIYVGEEPGRQQFDLIMVVDILDVTAAAVRIEELPYKVSYIYMTVTDKRGMTSALSPEWVWDCVTGAPYEG